MDTAVFTRYVYNKKNYLCYVRMDNNRKWIDFSMEREEKKVSQGEIYVARVERIVPNIKGAFVKISSDQNCYLPLSNVKKPFYTCKRAKCMDMAAGDELLVQIQKEAQKTKDPVVTTELSIHGSYCVLTTGNTQNGVSKKVSKEDRERLFSILNTCIAGRTLPDEVSKEFGIIIRTNGADTKPEILSWDIQSTIEQYGKIISTSAFKNFGTLVYEPESFLDRILKKIDIRNVESITTDQEDIYEALVSYYSHHVDDVSSRIRSYQDDAISLHTLYGFRKHMEELTSTKVWLPCGGNILIETLETLTVIDVNSAKSQDKHSDFLLKLNLEAAKEVARQLKLRNISGMILVDFVNMKKSEEMVLIDFLKKELAKDLDLCSFIDITKLGLVEITRKKQYPPLHEILSK